MNASPPTLTDPTAWDPAATSIGTVANPHVVHVRSATPRARPTTPTARVLHLVNGEHYSGAERVQDLLAMRLPEFGFEVGFACVKPGRFPSARKCRDAPIHAVVMSSKFDLRAAWPLWRIVKEANYELIHAHTPRTAVLGRIVSSLAGRPLVYHVHSPTNRDSTRRLSNRVNAAAERASLRGAAHLIAVSESLGRHLRKIGFREEHITVVRNGVPQVRTRQRDAPRHEWMLGTVALFRPRKGLEVLLEALAGLRKRFSVKLRAVGPFESTAYEAELKSFAVRLGLEGAIEWTGFVRDVNTELERTDLFVLPSLFGEGLPMVVLEAMAAGVPVVGTRVEGIPEAVRDAVDGVIAEPGDANDLAGAIGRVVSGELNWSRLRASAIVRHAERFSDETMAAGVASVYRRILDETRR